MVVGAVSPGVPDLPWGSQTEPTFTCPPLMSSPFLFDCFAEVTRPLEPWFLDLEEQEEHWWWLGVFLSELARGVLWPAQNNSVYIARGSVSSCIEGVNLTPTWLQSRWHWLPSL